MIWIFIFIMLVLIIYTWSEIYKFQIMFATLIVKEKAKDMHDEIMKDLDFKGGHFTEKN